MQQRLFCLNHLSHKKSIVHKTIGFFYELDNDIDKSYGVRGTPILL